MSSKDEIVFILKVEAFNLAQLIFKRLNYYYYFVCVRACAH